MPGMTGLEVLAQIRGQRVLAKTPVVLVSGKVDDEDIMRGYECGADYYITKPCRPRQSVNIENADS